METIWSDETSLIRK